MDSQNSSSSSASEWEVVEETEGSVNAPAALPPDLQAAKDSLLLQYRRMIDENLAKIAQDHHKQMQSSNVASSPFFSLSSPHPALSPSLPSSSYPRYSQLPTAPPVRFLNQTYPMQSAHRVAPFNAVPCVMSAGPIAPVTPPETPHCVIADCGATKMEKSCIYCSTSYCLQHIPPKILPDAKNILPFRCPPCSTKKSTGGLSYMERTESAQRSPLTHICYQPFNVTESPSQRLTDVFEKTVLTGGAASILSDDENMMKEYVLFPQKRSVVLTQLTLSDVINHVVDKRAVVFHYKFDSEELVTKCPSTVEANIFLSIMTRKGVPYSKPKKDHSYPDDSEKLSLARTRILTASDSNSNSSTDSPFASTEAVGPNKSERIPSLHTRVELYFETALWNSLTRQQRSEFKYLEHLVEDHMQSLFVPINAEKHKFLSLVHTRDCVRVKMVPVVTHVTTATGTSCTRTDFYFPPDAIPEKYILGVHGKMGPHGVPAGVHTFNGLFSEKELDEIEAAADVMDMDGRGGKFSHLPHTRQESFRGDKLVRTKFFFGARYLWTKDQTSDRRDMHRAAGVRVDVSPLPDWIKQKVEDPMVRAGLAAQNFFNSYAVNVYHDGTEGLHQHYDDMRRFSQPIFSLRIFSDCRLAFGSRGLAMTNTLFFVPMPRGCITVLEDQSFAANAIKHCIRPQDMVEKSAAIILRQIHPEVMKEAQNIAQEGELSRWICSIPGLENPMQIAATCMQEGLTLDSIRYVSECDLKLLGVTKMGPRKLLCRAIRMLSGDEEDPIGVCQHNCCSCDCPNYSFVLRDKVERSRTSRHSAETLQPVAVQPATELCPTLLKRIQMWNQHVNKIMTAAPVPPRPPLSATPSPTPLRPPLSSSFVPSFSAAPPPKPSPPPPPPPLPPTAEQLHLREILMKARAQANQWPGAVTGTLSTPPLSPSASPPSVFALTGASLHPAVLATIANISKQTSSAPTPSFPSLPPAATFDATKAQSPSSLSTSADGADARSPPKPVHSAPVTVSPTKPPAVLQATKPNPYLSTPTKRLPASSPSAPASVPQPLESPSAISPSSDFKRPVSSEGEDAAKRLRLEPN